MPIVRSWLESSYREFSLRRNRSGPRPFRPLILGVVVGVIFAGGVMGAGSSSPQQAPGGTTGAGLSIAAGPRWGQGPAGAWSPYLVTLSNDGLSDFDGTVVLLPRSPPPPGASPGLFDLNTPGRRPPETYVAPVAVLEPVRPLPNIDFSGLPPTVPPPVYTDSAGLPAAPPAAPQVWPSYQTPVTLAAGGHKTLTLLVLEAPYGYRVELRDRAGRTVASQGPTSGSAVGRSRWAVAVLGATGASDILTAAAPGTAHLSDLNVTSFVSGSDFPDNAMDLVGLQAVIVADIDTASLRPAQLRAMQTFVGLGGSLVLTGGATWQRTLDSLPNDLVPLRPTAAVITSVAPLGDGGTTTATVDTGTVTFGRVEVQSTNGTPLVVDGEYGSGRVVQMAYDPFAEPFASNAGLGAPAMEAGLGPALDGLKATQTTSPPENLWWPVLDQARDSSPGRNWPAWNLWLLGAYVLLAGPATYFLTRRRPRRDLVLVAVPLVALLLA